MKTRFRLRRGKTLIEMLVVMVGISAVLVTAGQMLLRLGRVERTVRDSAAIGRAEVRLARAFRTDARAASAADPLDENGSGLRLTTPAGPVEYALRDGSIQRTVGTAESPRREGYKLGEVTAAFAVEDGRYAVLSVEPRRESGPRDAVAGPFQIVAAIGADRSLVASDADESETEPVEAPKPASGEGA